MRTGNLSSRSSEGIDVLLSYKFSNFQSFKSETEIDLRLGKKSPTRGWERVSPSGERVTTALAVFGANAAGKTAVLKPLAFAAWFIARSFSAQADAQIPVTPHFARANEPTTFELEADDRAGVTWRYELEVDRSKVIREALYRKQIRYSYVFVRELGNDGGYDVKQQGFGLAPAEAKKVRPNASLISTARQYGVELAEHVADFLVATNITVVGRNPFHWTQLRHASALFGENEDLRPKMIELLRSWDLGLSGVHVERRELPQPDGSKEEAWVAFGNHEVNGRTYQLPMDLESSGTQSAYLLLSRLLFVLEYGGVAVIDEMESDLHPMLLEPILEMFDKESTNPHGAQILFTCHSSKVLDLLQKAQVVFVEKNQCQSEAFRGDDVEGLRSDDNLKAKYETGAIGAIPQL